MRAYGWGPLLSLANPSHRSRPLPLRWDSSSPCWGWWLVMHCPHSNVGWSLICLFPNHSSAEPSGTLAALSASQSVRQTQPGIQARRAPWLVARGAEIQGNAPSPGKGDTARRVPGGLSPEPRMSQDISDRPGRTSPAHAL